MPTLRILRPQRLQPLQVPLHHLTPLQRRLRMACVRQMFRMVQHQFRADQIQVPC